MSAKVACGRACPREIPTAALVSSTLGHGQELGHPECSLSQVGLICHLWLVSLPVAGSCLGWKDRTAEAAPVCGCARAQGALCTHVQVHVGVHVVSVGACRAPALAPSLPVLGVGRPRLCFPSCNTVRHFAFPLVFLRPLHPSSERLVLIGRGTLEGDLYLWEVTCSWFVHLGASARRVAEGTSGPGLMGALPACPCSEPLLPASFAHGGGEKGAV